MGMLLTPIDVWGNRQRTLGNVSKAMTISILILLFEDFPQLGFNIEYVKTMGVANDPIAILSLIASAGNIVYNLCVLAYEACSGEVPYLPDAPELGGAAGATGGGRSRVEVQLAAMTAENKELKRTVKNLKALLAQNGISTDNAKQLETFGGFDSV